MEDIVTRLRKRAEIRRKVTCRGLEDRIAALLDEAAARIEWLQADLDEANNLLREIPPT